MPDAFEIAVIDSIAANSLLPAMDGLTHGDALLNIQPDNRVYFAPGVTVPGVTGIVISDRVSSTPHDSSLQPTNGPGQSPSS